MIFNFKKLGHVNSIHYLGRSPAFQKFSPKPSDFRKTLILLHVFLFPLHHLFCGNIFCSPKHLLYFSSKCELKRLQGLHVCGTLFLPDFKQNSKGQSILLNLIANFVKLPSEILELFHGSRRLEGSSPKKKRACSHKLTPGEDHKCFINLSSC
jgi:hypothetical protein